ncbi:MAG: PAS domain S-box protein [Natrialbaceae archaeon]|nr:PAS domain S-box protein [Natrialbaceae archaeon]
MGQALSASLRETLAIFEREGNSNDPLTTAEVTDHLDISRRSTYDRLGKLVEKGELRSKKVGGAGRIWWRPSVTGPTDHRSRKNLRLHESSEDVYVTLDEDGRFQYISVESIFGYQTDVIKGRDAFEFVHPEDREEARDKFNELTGSGSTEEKHLKIRFRHPDNSWVYLAIDAKNLLDDPVVQGVGIFARDISDRYEREQELELYETIIDQVGEGVYVLDEDFKFTHVNDAYVEMTGYEREELLGSHATLVVSQEVSQETLRRSLEMTGEDGASDTLEADIHRADGTTLRAENRFGVIADKNGSTRKVGVVRDVSDRIANERELKHRIEQEEVIADLGRKALEREDIESLLEMAVEHLSDVLGTDYGTVLELDHHENVLFLRKGVGWNDEIPPVPAIENRSQTAYTLFAESPVIVEQLGSETRFDQEAMLTNHDVSSGITALIGSKEDPWGILGTFDQVTRSFSTYDANFVQAVANILASAINRHSREQELKQNQRQLATLNNLNTVVQDITAGVIEQSTRTEIEQTVCDHIATSDSYTFAWTGDVKPHENDIVPRTEANTNGYLDQLTLGTDSTQTSGLGPAGEAARTGEPHVIRDVYRDESFEPWREQANEHGFRGVAAIPIETENSLYGILAIYTQRQNAFADEELRVISQLGRTIGHAISAVERKQALMSDRVTELQFSIPQISEVIGIAPGSGTVHFDEVIDVGDDRYVIFGQSNIDRDQFKSVIDTVPGWESIRFVGEGTRFELLLTDPPVFSMIAARGGEIRHAKFENDEYQFTIHLPPAVETREIIDKIKQHYPIELLVRRQVSREQHGTGAVHEMLQTLTDRQRTALETAFHSGFFEWPRETTGEEIAKTLDIAAPTFHQHLRRAERELVGAVLE